ncbi:hypothetical protein LCGC14_1280600, partial [marine sediment metagenome]
RGVTPKESRDIISELTKKHGDDGFDKLRSEAKGVRDYGLRTVLHPLRETGILSKEAFDRITKSGEFYTPFKRAIDNLEEQGFLPRIGGAFQPKSAGIKRIKGSEKKIVDPLETIISETYRVTDLVMRHDVAKSLVGLRALSKEAAEAIVPVKGKVVSVGVTEKGKQIFRPSFFNPETNTMMVFENGVRKFYKVEPELMKALSGMSQAEMGMMMKIISLPARTLRAGATGVPEFIVRNAWRDQFTAYIFSKYGYKPFVDLVPGVFSLIGKNETFFRWQAAGGDQAMFVSLDRAANQLALQDVLAKRIGAPSVRAFRNIIKGTAKSPLFPLQALSSGSEKGTRIGLFRKAKIKGASDIEAMFEARDTTLDFGRMGLFSTVYNRITAFFNANMQGTETAVRKFKVRPFITTTRAISSLTIPTIALYLHNKDNPRYKELPQWRKDIFWNFVPDNDEATIISLPKPFLMGQLFGTSVEHILTWVNENEPEQLSSIPKALLEGSAPGTIPTIALPIIENSVNFSFFRDRPIVSQSVQQLPPEMQSNTYTSETAKAIGKLIKVSPAKIENLSNGYFAGMGQYALEVSDELLKVVGITDPIPPPIPEAADLPVIRAFVAREPRGPGSASVDKFFNILDKAREATAGAKLLVEAGDMEGGVDMLRKNPESLLVKGLNGVARNMAKVRARKDAILESRTISPERKREIVNNLDDLITELAKQALIVVENAAE